MSRAPRVRGGWLLGVYLILFICYLESPLIIIFLTSLNDGLTVTFPPSGYSLRWYVRLWEQVRQVSGTKPGLTASLWTSMWLGGVVTVGSVVAGLLAAFTLHRHAFRGRAALRQAFLLPLVFPQIVTGIGLLLVFSAVPGVPSYVRLLLGHLTLTLPYVIVTIEASLTTLDRRLEEAAMNLGANGMQAFWYITVPGLRSGIISGALFAWLVSFANFTVTFFLFSGEARPLPVWIFEFIQYGVDPSLAALSTFLILLTLIVVATLNRVFALGRVVGLRR